MTAPRPTRAEPPLPWLPRFDRGRLLAAQLELLDQSFGVAMLGCALASWILASGLILHGLHADAWVWALAVSGVSALGHFGRRWLPHRTEESGAGLYARCLTALVTTNGTLWGLAGWLYLDLGSPQNVISVLALIAGMSAAALAVFSACLPVAIGFFLPAILPVWARFLTSGDVDLLAVFLAVPLYLAVLVIFARNYASVARHSIALRFDNIELISQLRDQTARAEAAQHAAEDASRAKSVFLASASHDLRQPLHALGLFLVTLGRTALNDKQRQLLAHIDASSGAAREMLNTLLDFSKLEAGVVRAHPQAFRLQTLLHKLENEFAPLADARGLVYRTRDTTCALYADPALVELILRNLITNAIRYTQAGGVLVACRRRGSLASIEVWDTGIGVPPDQHEAIFREFHQLGNPERDQRKGLGLGLAIVDGLARTLDTRVEVASVPGRGSVFRFSLPLSWLAPAAGRAASTAAPVAPALAPSLKGLRVLIVDDDPHIRMAMTELLREWACECRALESEDDAIVEIGPRPRAGAGSLVFEPDLILADYRLRGNRDGLQAIAAIRARLGRAVPAIVITGDTAPDRLRSVHASGAALLHKPVVPEDLHTAMLQLVIASRLRQ